MKKRAFLSPLAISVAALLSGAPASASVPDTHPVTNETATIAVQANVLGDPFVIERSGETGVQTAQHRSHWSHRSHASHRSHLSSGW